MNCDGQFRPSAAVRGNVACGRARNPGADARGLLTALAAVPGLDDQCDGLPAILGPLRL